MRYAVIDTEGSGLFKFKDANGVSVPADAEGQPRMAALAMIFLGPELEIESEYHWLIKPDGWKLEPEAAAVNGLTMERLEAEGVPVTEALDAYAAAILQDDRVIVAFNAQHDCKTMRAELRRAGRDDLFMKTRNICAMRAAKDHMKVNKGYKLADVCKFFAVVQTGAHTALGDAHACVKIFRKLHALGALPEAKVHLAKNPPVKEVA